MKEVKRRFIEHKYSARRRGISFNFTFEEWVSWWEANLGPDWLDKRGCRHGQYVMARKGDCGAYEAGNVKCITCSRNTFEQKVNGTSASGERHGHSKLTDAAIAKIRSSKLTSRCLAKQLNVHCTTIERVRRKATWVKS